MPRGAVGENTWDWYLDAEEITLSSGSRTRTVSRSMNWDWVRAAFHGWVEEVVGGGVVMVYNIGIGWYV